MSVINAIRPLELRSEIKGKESPEALKKALTEFESLFINQMLTSMRDTVTKSDLFHGGSGEKVFASMFDTELSKIMAEAGGIGLSDILMKQLSREYAEPKAGAAPVKGELELPQAAKAQAPQPEKALPVNSGPYGGVPEPGTFSFPLKGASRISSEFGHRADPFTGQGRFHHGIDIAARQGTPVFPAAPGKVLFSGNRGTYGNVVEIMHDNGLVTRYGHNEKNIVKEGDTVLPSEPIAYVGSTGRSTGPHLHFEVLENGSAVDPARFYG